MVLWTMPPIVPHELRAIKTHPSGNPGGQQEASYAPRLLYCTVLVVLYSTCTCTQGGDRGGGQGAASSPKLLVGSSAPSSAARESILQSHSRFLDPPNFFGHARQQCAGRRRRACERSCCRGLWHVAAAYTTSATAFACASRHDDECTERAWLASRPHSRYGLLHRELPGAVCDRRQFRLNAVD